MRVKQRILGLSLAVAVAAGMSVVGAPDALALVVPVNCNGMQVGSIVVNAQGAGRGISGGFFPAIPTTLAGAAAACGETQFNWYQVVTADNGRARNAAGMRLMAPYVDPPPGGYSTQWADNLPWYYDMTPPPAGAMNVDPDLQLSANINATNTVLNFSDNPTSAGNISFSTWLVSLNANGSFQSFDGGFTWRYNTGNMTVDMLMANNANPGAALYNNLIGGFATQVPEPSTWALLLIGFGGVVFLRRGAGATA